MWLTLVLALSSVLLAVGLVLCWLLRPGSPGFASVPGLESWTVVPARGHNAFVDLVRWEGKLLLVHVASPYHAGTPRSRVIVRRSVDGRSFEQIASLRLPGRDIRDPKLGMIAGRLFLYVQANDSFFAVPSETLVATSENGEQWTAFEPVGAPPGARFWRPESPDGRTWYVPAVMRKPARALLLRSGDGRRWSEVSTIHEGEGADETAVAFGPEGRAVATVRLEPEKGGLLGSERGGTVIATADPPYEHWKQRTSRVTRLDGPALFAIGDRFFAVGRHQPGERGLFTRLGSAWSRKRTALYRVGETELRHLADLPSTGDTSYAGVVFDEDAVLVAYYTTRPDRDVPWLLGMFLPTEIRMARVPLSWLLAAEEP
jgi:hypothetical protein